MRFLPDQRDPTVAVLGLGYVGSCTAAALADRGWSVIGVDVNAELIDELVGGHCRYQEDGLPEMLASATAAGRLKITSDYAHVQEADVVLLAVSTPVHPDGSLQDDQLREACLHLGAQLREGQLVLVKSTVPPGTTRDLVLPLLERSGLIAGEHFGLAFCPERLAEGTALHELRTLPITVGGVNTESTEAGEEFWRRGLGVPVIPLSSPEAAEIVKLADNWWIDLNIALANELAKFSALFDVDVLDVIAAANTVPKGGGKVNILLPSVGVGGSCLVKDPWMVWHSARRHGLEIHTAPVGRTVNLGMPEYTAQLVIDELVRIGKDPATSTVAVLGAAFKNDTGDLRATPVEAFITTLAKAGAAIRVYDPLVDPVKAEALLGVKPSASLPEAVRDADCLAITAFHEQFKDIDFAELPVASSCLILDGRAYYSKEKITSLRRMGYAYVGVGR